MLFRGFFARFVPRNSPAAPNQHRPFWTWLGEPDNTGPPCSLLHFPTSTPKPRAEGRVRASGTQATSRPERSGDQVLLPLPQNRRKHCVSAGFLFTCVVWLWCSRWFRQWVFTSVCICPHLLPSPPAPKTHPVSPFSAFPGGVRFLPSLGPQKFGDDFMAWLAAPVPFEHRKGRDCPRPFPTDSSHAVLPV